MKRNRSRKPAALFIFIITFGCGKPAPLTPEELAKSDLYVTNIETAPIEYQLAFQDSGELPRGNDVNAARIRYLLKALARWTGDSESHIGDQTSRSTGVLRGRGKRVTNQGFLEVANYYFIAGGPRTNFNDLSNALIVTLDR